MSELFFFGKWRFCTKLWATQKPRQNYTNLQTNLSQKKRSYFSNCFCTFFLQFFYCILCCMLERHISFSSKFALYLAAFFHFFIFLSKHISLMTKALRGLGSSYKPYSFFSFFLSFSLSLSLSLPSLMLSARVEPELCINFIIYQRCFCGKVEADSSFQDFSPLFFPLLYLLFSRIEYMKQLSPPFFCLFFSCQNF